MGSIGGRSTPGSTSRPSTTISWPDVSASFREETQIGCGAALELKRAPGRDATVREAWKLSESDFGNDLIQISFIGDAVVIYEPNGWHGVDEELAGVLSQRGRYAAYYWNVNAVMRFVFAVNGHIQRDFDPLLYDADREQALPEELDLPFPSARHRIADPWPGVPGAHRTTRPALKSRGSGCSPRRIRPTASIRSCRASACGSEPQTARRPRSRGAHPSLGQQEMDWLAQQARTPGRCARESGAVSAVGRSRPCPIGRRSLPVPRLP